MEYVIGLFSCSETFDHMSAMLPWTSSTHISILSIFFNIQLQIPFHLDIIWWDEERRPAHLR